METIISFIGAHWVIFLVIAILLIFALVGYLVDSNSIEEDKGETIKLDNTKKEPAKVEEVEVLSTVADTIQNNQEQNTEEVKEEVKETTTSETTTQDGTQPLIQEDNSNVSTFEG